MDLAKIDDKPTADLSITRAGNVAANIAIQLFLKGAKGCDLPFLVKKDPEFHTNDDEKLPELNENQFNGLHGEINNQDKMIVCYGAVAYVQLAALALTGHKLAKCIQWVDNPTNPSGAFISAEDRLIDFEDAVGVLPGSFIGFYEVRGEIRNLKHAMIAIGHTDEGHLLWRN